MNKPMIKLTRRKPIWIDSQRPLTQWYSSALGQSILDRLEVQLQGSLSDVFGYQGLQIGNVAPDRDLFKGSGLHRRIILDAPGSQADIHGDVLHLPVASDTMKLVMFFNTLDFCDQPHQALREADRVLSDDGQLLIIGFNPLSAFGARHVLTGWRGNAPWNGRFYSRTRVTDWLSVLNYRVQTSDAMFIRLPIDSEGLLRRTRRLERIEPLLSGIGGLYVLLARKQTMPLTPSRRHWRRQQRPSVAVSSFARARETAAMRKSDPKTE